MAEQQTTSTSTTGEEQPTRGMSSMPRLPIPGMPSMPTATTGRVLWWGGLAALAALDILEWPVAIVVGAGTWVAEQAAKQDLGGQLRTAQQMPAQRTTSPE